MMRLPIGQLTLDGALRVTAVDHMFVEVFGGTDAELVGRELDELVSDRDPRGARELASQLSQYRGGIIDLPLVLRVAKRDRYVRLRMMRVDGQYLAYIEPSEDASSVAFQLALLKQRWQSVVNRSDDGIAILDATGVVLEHNERFIQLLQFRSSHGVMLASEALLGRRLVDLLGKAHAELGGALAGSDDEIHLTLSPDECGRVLDIKGRTVKIPVRGRVELFLLVRDITDEQQVRQRDQIIQADLQQAAGFQRSVLAALPAVPNLDIDVAYHPLDAVGGDLYDVTLLPDGTLRLFIGDATGHGVKAALATLLIKSEYDLLKDQGGTPGRTLEALNDRILRAHQSLDLMLTGVIADISPDGMWLRYSNGAHPSPLLVSGDRVRELSDGGPFIGALGNATFPEFSESLAPGDAIVLVTDGLAETRNSLGVLFGEDRLQASIGRAYARRRSVIADVMADVTAHRAMCPPTDDITLLAVTPKVMS